MKLESCGASRYLTITMLFETDQKKPEKPQPRTDFSVVSLLRNDKRDVISNRPKEA